MGCLVETSTASEATGYLTFYWSIENATSAGVCDLYGASRLEFVVYGPSQREVTRIYRDCDEFELTLPLEPGAYSANATLVNTAAQAVSTTLPLSGIRIARGEALVIRADFPAKSRL